jgi:Lon protease-like protein
MGSHLEPLPLLMMRTVLYPYASLQLHMSDGLHLRMIRECDAEERYFGVVLLREGEDDEPYLVGTAARVESILEHEHGAADVKLHGEWRFRIRKFDTSQDYVTGMVEPVFESEVEDRERLRRILMRCQDDLHQLFSGYFGQVGARVAEVRFDDDPSALSFLVAKMLPMPETEKQLILENTDPLERLELLIPLLERQIFEATVVPMPDDDEDEWIKPN